MAKFDFFNRFCLAIIDREVVACFRRQAREATAFAEYNPEEVIQEEPGRKVVTYTNPHTGEKIPGWAFPSSVDETAKPSMNYIEFKKWYARRN